MYKFQLCFSRRSVRIIYRPRAVHNVQLSKGCVDWLASSCGNMCDITQARNEKERKKEKKSAPTSGTSCQPHSVDEYGREHSSTSLFKQRNLVAESYYRWQAERQVSARTGSLRRFDLESYCSGGRRVQAFKRISLN